MSAYRHFGLQQPPFEQSPDPRFYYRSKAHEEALATLRYTVFASKSCCVIVGDSGSGKTILGRMICQSTGSHTAVLWIHGIGQPERATEVSVYSPGALSGANALPAAHETTLAEWTRANVSTAVAVGQAPRRPALIILDNADELPEHGWRDVLALQTREVAGVVDFNMILLGMPHLLERLDEPSLVRLRRRVFRTCTLPPLRLDGVRAYVDHRIAVAGGKGPEIFTDEAIAHLHSLTRGIPALINQVCDNALLEVYGQARKQVVGSDILPAVQATVGIPSSARSLLEAPAMERRPSHVLPAVIPHRPRLEPPRQIEPPRRSKPPKEAAPALPVPPVLARVRRIKTALVAQLPTTNPGNPAVRSRLQQLEGRLARALEVVRRARELRSRDEPIDLTASTEVLPPPRPDPAARATPARDTGRVAEKDA